jgi:uncharacterized membrane protein (DUF106 family)
VLTTAKSPLPFVFSVLVSSLIVSMYFNLCTPYLVATEFSQNV